MSSRSGLNIHGAIMKTARREQPLQPVAIDQGSSEESFNAG
jgi:hypothetical protein